MFTALGYVRGDVVASPDGVGIVWSCGRGHLKILPFRRNNIPRKRTDVILDTPSDQAACGVGPDMMVRCGGFVTVRDPQAKVGHAPDSLMARMTTAMVRGAETAAIEARQWAAPADTPISVF